LLLLLLAAVAAAVAAAVTLRLRVSCVVPSMTCMSCSGSEGPAFCNTFAAGEDTGCGGSFVGLPPSFFTILDALLLWVAGECAAAAAAAAAAVGDADADVDSAGEEGALPSVDIESLPPRLLLPGC
jgi:hypothetical protein